LVHAGKYGTEDKLRDREYQKINATQKANNTKQNWPGSVVSYDTRPGNEMGLFYDAPEP